jgi:tRNA (guanine37-N1)-methyltransferase
MFESVLNESILKRARLNKLIKFNIHNLRDWSNNKHKTVDSSPYGGGAGMVLKVDVIDRALASIKKKAKSNKIKIILLTPQGKTFNQKRALELSKQKHILLICGHYEGFDERVRKLVDEQISIGDYVLTGGEIPAMAICDSITRLIPGVLGNDASNKDESFSSENYTEYPQYTRPEIYRTLSKKYKNSLKVPKILLSGNHKAIKNWRQEQSTKRSKKHI